MSRLLRSATADDHDFLLAMLGEAADWSGRRLTPAEIMAAPALAHYVAGWPRAGDIGVVAAQDVPVGAAWLRFFEPDDPGYGFVRAGVPEIAMAVVAEHRGHGIGRALLRELAAAATRKGIEALSLSVDRANPAARLYRDEGYAVVTRGTTSDTMLKDLYRGHAATPRR